MSTIIMFVLISLYTSFHYIVFRKYSYKLESPLYFFIIFTNLTLFISILYNNFFPDYSKINLFGFDNNINNNQWDTLIFYIVAVCSFLLPFVIKKNTSKQNLRKLHKKHIDKYNRILILAILLIIINMILISSSFGVENIFYRDKYLPALNKGLETFRVIIMLINIILIGLLYKKYKFISIFLISIILLISFSTGSRKFVLYLLLYLIITLPYWSKKNFTFKLTMMLLSSLIFLALVFNLRNNTFHGLIPYFFSIFNTELSDIFDKIVFFFYYTFVYGFNVTVSTMEIEIESFDTLYISLSPLPGSMVGWYETYPKLMLNKFAPFNLYGEVFSLGIWFTILFFSIIGYSFFYIEKYQRKLIMNNSLFKYVVIFFTLLFIMMASQYLLRSSLRQIYYLIFFILVHKYIFTYRWKS